MRLAYLLLCLLILSCETKDNNKTLPGSITIKQDSLVVADTAKTIIGKQRIYKSEIPYTKITNSTQVKIISSSKHLDTASIHFEDDREKCNNWNLSEKDIKAILTSSIEIDGPEWHHLYAIFPCYYGGEISIDGKISSYEINAGASSVVFFKDTSVWLGYKKPDFEKYFLLGPAYIRDPE
jgi:hypothetical protein